jgi:hypothetical protein
MDYVTTWTKLLLHLQTEIYRRSKKSGLRLRHMRSIFPMAFCCEEILEDWTISLIDL